jgi:hypothetical protein
MFRRQSSFEQRHAVDRVLILQAEGRGERTDAEVERLQPAILSPKLEYVAGILAVRSAEIEQHIIFEVAEQLAVNAVTGAAQHGAVAEIACAIRIVRSAATRQSQAKVRGRAAARAAGPRRLGLLHAATARLFGSAGASRH